MIKDRVAAEIEVVTKLSRESVAVTVAKLTDMITELKVRGAAAADQDPYALALLWTSLTAGLAAHHLADPKIDLRPALDLAQRYATSLR